MHACLFVFVYLDARTYLWEPLSGVVFLAMFGTLYKETR